MELLLWDSLDRLKEMEDNSVDSIVCDPPYGISFMWKKWDYDVPQKEVWAECLRVLKPWWHALIACWTRTQHRMAVNIEDWGFEIRDIIAWVYGSWFPKSHNIGKAVDKLQGNEREDLGRDPNQEWRTQNVWQIAGMEGGYGKWKERIVNITKWTSPHEGRGTALKPACEYRTLCRKPLSEKTIAKNVLKHWTGGINIDECRVGDSWARTNQWWWQWKMVWWTVKNGWVSTEIKPQWRFPANLIHDWSDEVVDLFPWEGDKSNARFFYCSKASKSERNKGLEEQCTHPTVKPIKLMQYLCRLITPKWGTILDPYVWSWSTGIGAKLWLFDFIGIEREEEYVELARARIDARETE